MKDNTKHFIQTSDPETAKMLRLELTEIDKQDGKFTFINDFSKLNFSQSDIDNAKLSYTNILHM